MLEYWENLGFKKPYAPGVWEILKSGGGLFARHRCVIEKSCRLISLSQLPYNTSLHPDGSAQTDLPAYFLWSGPDRPDADF